jgi:hypothetical protein
LNEYEKLQFNASRFPASSGHFPNITVHNSTWFVECPEINADKSNEIEVLRIVKHIFGTAKSLRLIFIVRRDDPERFDPNDTVPYFWNLIKYKNSGGLISNKWSRHAYNQFLDLDLDLDLNGCIESTLSHMWFEWSTEEIMSLFGELWLESNILQCPEPMQSGLLANDKHMIDFKRKALEFINKLEKTVPARSDWSAQISQKSKNDVLFAMMKLSFEEYFWLKLSRTDDFIHVADELDSEKMALCSDVPMRTLLTNPIYAKCKEADEILAEGDTDKILDYINARPGIMQVMRSDKELWMTQRWCNTLREVHRVLSTNEAQCGPEVDVKKLLENGGSISKENFEDFFRNWQTFGLSDFEIPPMPNDGNKGVLSKHLNALVLDTLRLRPKHENQTVSCGE